MGPLPTGGLRVHGTYVSVVWACTAYYMPTFGSLHECLASFPHGSRSWLDHYLLACRRLRSRISTMAQDRIFTFIKGQSKGDKKMKELVSDSMFASANSPCSLLAFKNDPIEDWTHTRCFFVLRIGLTCTLQALLGPAVESASRPSKRYKLVTDDIVPCSFRSSVARVPTCARWPSVASTCPPA